MKSLVIILLLSFSNYAFSDELDRRMYSRQKSPTQIKVMVTFPDVMERPIPQQMYMEPAAAVDAYAIYRMSGGLAMQTGVSVIAILDDETHARAERVVTKERGIASQQKSDSSIGKQE